MYKEITNEQMADAAQAMLRKRFGPRVSPNELNLHFHPELVACDGPGHSLTFRFHTYPWMTNPGGVTHGGIIAALFDNAMGMTCTTLYQAMTPTITLTVNYARPVPLERDVLIRTHAVTTGGTSAQLTAELYFENEPDALLATASGVYYTAQAAEQKKSELV